jgi:hypothetical protein
LVKTTSQETLAAEFRLHVFLWLWANNKILTRDNLAKRQHLDDPTCVFCAENVPCDHLFFECVVAREVWRIVAPLTGIVCITKMLDISSKWVCVKKFEERNIVHSAVLWSLWKT